MKVPMWIRVSAVVFSVSVGGMYIAYATGFHGFIGDIPSGSAPLQPEPASPDEVPFPKFTEDLLIPSTKSGGIFTPPAASADESKDVHTASPTTIPIPQAGLPELGLFGPDPTPVIVVPPDLPRIDLNDRRFIPSTKSFSPRHIQPPQPTETQ